MPKLKDFHKYLDENQPVSNKRGRKNSSPSKKGKREGKYKDEYEVNRSRNN